MRRPPIAVAAAIAAVVIGAAVVVVSRGSGEKETLRETSEKLSEVRSGQLAMRFVIAPLSEARDSDVGFAVEGRFALGRPGGLPDADLAYTQIAGPEQETVRIVSDGQAAWVRVGGQAYTLPPERTARLRRSADGDGGEGAAGLDALRIDRWIADPNSSDGGRIDGVATTRITGKLRVATALQDLLALGRRAGTDVGAKSIGEETSEKLEDAKEDASITLHTGKDDRILRRLRLRASFPLKRTRDLGGTIGRLRGAEVRFSLSLRRVGRPVSVKAPTNAQPYSALNGGA